jgi:hypothetical protein
VADTKLSTETERELAEQIARFRYDPLGFVMFNFPWGVKGSPLQNKTGPEKWQRDFLIALGEFMVENAYRKEQGLDYKVWRSAVGSGHGVGKSALVAWLIYFFMSTRADCRGGVTATTGSQLESKTWPELSKWHKMAVNAHWFTWSATSFYFRQYGEQERKNYMFNALTVAEETVEGFQGLHNETSAIVAIFDEASGIFDKLWEVVEGSMTDGEPFFFSFGNITRPDGEFVKCFVEHRGRMSYVAHVDSRSVSFTNKAALQDILDKYGIDSDEARVRVYGQIPSKSFDGFIPEQVSTDAMNRLAYLDSGAALIMACDVGHMGDDSTEIGWRQARNARVLPWVTFHRLNVPEVAEKIAILANKHQPDAIAIEAVGIGVGVIDILKTRRYRVMQVGVGARMESKSNFYNLRAKLWYDTRDWLINGGAIPNDAELHKQLTSMRYGYDRAESKMIMESKRDMKSRGLPSPNKADTLMLTLAPTVARRDSRLRTGQSSSLAVSEYDPYA